MVRRGRVTGVVVDEYRLVHRQSGFLDLGKPRDEFEYPTDILGTEDAEEMLASRDAARVEGTMRKLMGDTGDEL